VAGLLQKIARRPSSAPPSLQELLQDLQKRVRRLVNRLYHRKEMEILHIEADLDPIITDDGENLSVLEAAPAPGLDPSEELIQKEEQGEFEQLKERFHRFLGQDQLLKDLFGCLCAGILKRAAIARKLGLTPSWLLTPKSGWPAARPSSIGKEILKNLCARRAKSISRLLI